MALNLAFRYPQRVVGLVLSRPAWLDSPRPENLKAYPMIARLLREHGAKLGKKHFEGTEEYAELERAAPGRVARWPHRSSVGRAPGSTRRSSSR